MARNALSAPWLPTMNSMPPVTHAARLVIVARTTMFVNVTRAVIPCVVMKGTVEDITLIVAKEISTLTIVKVTEVRSQEVCAKEARAKEVRAHEGDLHGRGRQGGDQYRVRFSTDGNDDWRHARAAPAI
jgi:hypothetical protein